MALAAALCLVGLVAFLAFQLRGSTGRAEAAAPKQPTDALEFILRLGDLPLGYEVIDGDPDAGVGGLMCDRVDPANTQPKLDDFLTRSNKPAGCLALYYRTYRVPGAQSGPLVLGTGAMRLASADAAAEGLAIAPQLLSHALDDELPEEAAPAAVVGEATRLFHWRHGKLFGEGEETASFLIWRSGAVDAAIFVSGGKTAANDRAALALAQRQQARIENPTPVQPSDFDDSEVALENPDLKVPVYWLGKTFDPGHGLPPMTLLGSSASAGSSPFTPRLGLVYGDHPRRSRYEELFVNAYSAQQWKRLRARRRRLPGALACGATVHRLKVPGAIVFHGREKLLGRCRKDERVSWTLRVRRHGIVVTVATSEVCDICAEAGRGPYDSRRAMAAIARGLQRRERPSGS